ncbi:hypothetical protein AQUCO_07500006v1 [Aquilegia coerulea]|uniref:Methyltransferase-like protein 23 n=1 Tax=Aquilegia coerulea TaxID=218851 RepID=A0A2G5C934_AQUCA|nr:hypothetical protein AQUCO_07500006v1 [Aquilegia coerulea]PIA27787.1 hypothetical protein AQUCO_07500006v1 [Aquilegia coerulea]
MTSISSHSFGGDDQTSEEEEAFTIEIIENMEEEYGMFVWPCSIALAEYVWQQRLRFSGGVSVVELGAGTSLPGLVAAKLGSYVTLTDNSTRLEVLANMKRMCELNKINCQVLGLTWGEWEAPIFSLKPKVVLGADVLYDTKDFDNLFATVAFLLHNSPGAVFIATYHNRSGHHLIEYLMVKWSLKCTKLVDAYSFIPFSKASSIIGTIQLAEIMLDDSTT